MIFSSSTLTYAEHIWEKMDMFTVQLRYKAQVLWAKLFSLQTVASTKKLWQI